MTKTKSEKDVEFAMTVLKKTSADGLSWKSISDARGLVCDLGNGERLVLRGLNLTVEQQHGDDGDVTRYSVDAPGIVERIATLADGQLFGPPGWAWKALNNMPGNQ